MSIGYSDIILDQPWEDHDGNLDQSHLALQVSKMMLKTLQK